MMKQNLPDHHLSILTAQEVCALLRLPRSTVYYLTQVGKIPAVRIGKHWRYRRQEIERFLLEGASNQTHVILRARPEESQKKYLRSFANAQDDIQVEKRRFPRINVSFPCIWQVVIDDRKQVQGTGTIQNMSEGGVFVECESLQATQETLETDDPIHLTFDWLGVVQGRVVRLQKNGRTFFAVVFRHLEREVKKKIREFIG